jgi:hypothetical protein
MVENLKHYYDNPALSQSKLKLLIKTPHLFNSVKEQDLYYEEKKHFIIGSAVDVLLTQSEKVFKKQYHVSKVQNKPSDAIKSILHEVFDNLIESIDINDFGPIESTEYRTLILHCCIKQDYGKSYKDDTKISKVCEAYEYWNDLILAHGKQVLSVEEKTLIDNIVMSIRTNEVTSKYFEKDKDTEIFDQYFIEFEYEDVPCKALLDRIIVNHANKTIQPIDFKTMGDYTLNFPKTLKRNRYDIQASWYTLALQKVLQENYPGFTILPFKFIVESTINPGTPLVFTCSGNLLDIGQFGLPAHSVVGLTYFQEPHNSMQIPHRYPEVKGFYQLLGDYMWYLVNGFEKNKKIVEAQGEFIIDWEGIT